MAATALQILLDDGFAAMVQLEFDQMDRTLASDPAVA
jgi:hypothetical protein